MYQQVDSFIGLGYQGKDIVLKLEISSRVIISWRILVSFRGFLEDYIFAW